MSKKSTVSSETVTSKSVAPSTLGLMPFEDQQLSHSPIYLNAEDLIDSDLSVRPGETLGEHEDRVQRLMTQILLDGQQQPVKIIEVPVDTNGTGFKIVDGQGRVDAIRRLKISQRVSLPVWCVLSQAIDTWGQGVKLNVHRRNYTDLQLAELISTARTRYGWGEKGGEKKLAEFFGIKPTHLVEYNILASAPDDVKADLNKGTLSKYAALQLLKLTGENGDSTKRGKIVEEAQKAADTEAAAKPVKAAKAGKAVKTQEEIDKKYEASRKNIGKVISEAQSSKNKKPAAVEARHVVAAARKVAEESNEPAPIVKRGMSELMAGMGVLMESTTGTSEAQIAGRKFLKLFVAFREGTCTPKKLQNAWTGLVGEDDSVTEAAE